MGSLGQPGSPKPTLIERVIGFRGMPYTIGCALWAGFVTQGGLLFYYLDTLDYYRALAVFLEKDPASVSPIQTVFEHGLSFVGAFSIFYVVRYMRLKVVAARPLLASSLRGEQVFYRLFGRVSGAKLPLAITAVFLTIPISSLVSGNLPAPVIVPIPGVFSVVHAAIAFPVIFLGLFTFVWVYFTAIWGIHRLGPEILLRPFYEDDPLGVRPIGALSLSLAVGYFAGLGSFLLASGAAFSPGSGPLGSAVVFVLLGAAMFFVPLNSLHRRMVEEKAHLRASLRAQFAQLVNRSSAADPESTGVALARIESILMLETTERKVAAIHTWPFDTRTLNRFAAVVLSIIIILVGRYLTRLLLGL